MRMKHSIHKTEYPLSMPRSFNQIAWNE